MKNLKIYVLEVQDQSGQYLDANIEPPKFERWRHHHSIYHPTEGIWPHDRVNRIVKKYVGKQFDKAFSEYCAQVPIYQQHLFLEEFNPKYHYWRNTYRVDKQGNIQKVKPPKKDKRVYYYSDDYKTELRHKITNRLKPSSFSAKYIKGVKTYYDYASYYPYKTSTDKDYVEVCAKGYKLVFKSHKDREYRKLITQQQKRHRKAQLLKHKEMEAKAYSFLTKSEHDLLNQKALDLIKILKHGFDPATSFQGDHRVNPDVIKERQGY
jgi:hypothetical protein